MKRNSLTSHDTIVPKEYLGAVRRSTRQAFSLIELLVVIAITTILLGLLFGPIISSFNLTRRARAISQAQDAARIGLERLSREMGRATYIYDNGSSPVAIPMDYSDGTPTGGTDRRITTPGGKVGLGGPNITDWPLVAYSRIDIVQPAVRQDTTDVIDPTTGQPVGGAELQPGVRGKRVVRYFLGVKNPKKLYTNPYEFRRIDEDPNPVILYRAEYDPEDPNLFDVSRTAGSRGNYASNAPNSGGFNDPAFFYAPKIANTSLTDDNGNPVLDANGNPIVGNGRSYGENWQAIAQPVLVSENVDLLRWNRVGAATERDLKDADDPFTPTTTFSPVSVAGDVAVAGFLTSGGVETAASVPSLYQAKYGAWSYPYKITVLRGSTNFDPSKTRNPEPFGALSLTVDRDSKGNVYIVPNTGNPPERQFSAVQSLATTPAEFFTVYNPLTRKLFVKTARLTFQVDPDRGRIETAFPPLMGRGTTANGVPYYLPNGTVTITEVPSGFNPVAGDLIPTYYKIDTRDPKAGTGNIPVNQGILAADLFSPSYLPIQGGLAGAPTTLSPLVVFGESAGAASARGVRIIPGSERLTAPVVDQGIETAWARITGSEGGIIQPGSKLTGTTPGVYEKIFERRAQYIFDFDIYPTTAAEALAQIVHFDSAGTPPTDPALPHDDEASGMAASDTNGKNFLTASYLWQNNYSRNPNATDASWGYPMDSAGNVITSFSAARPEADIFRIDYATRQQYNINLGARIYDPTDGRAQSIQVTDKVIINNALR